jgi:hypothetical protein
VSIFPEQEQFRTEYFPAVWVIQRAAVELSSPQTCGPRPAVRNNCGCLFATGRIGIDIQVFACKTFSVPFSVPFSHKAAGRDFFDDGEIAIVS